MHNMKLDKPAEDGGQGGRSVQSLRVEGKDNMTSRPPRRFQSVAEM